MIRRGYHSSRQLGLDLLYERAQVSFDARVLVQQIRKPALPSLRLRGAGLLQLGARPGELLACLCQPPPGYFGFPRIAPAQQPGELPPGRLLHVSDSRGCHRLPSPLRYQNFSRHVPVAPFYARLGSNHRVAQLTPPSSEYGWLVSPPRVSGSSIAAACSSCSAPR